MDLTISRSRPRRCWSLALSLCGLGVAISTSFAKSLTAGSVNMFPSSIGTFDATIPWTVQRPDGVSQDCTHTTSSCLWETLQSVGSTFSLDLWGPGGALGSDTAIRVATMVSFPTLRNQYFRSHGGSIYGDATSLQTAVISIDSMVEAEFILDGAQIGMTQRGAYSETVLIKPQTDLPKEGFKAIADSQIKLGNVSREGDGWATVLIDVSIGNIVNTTLEALEINGAGSTATPHSDNCVFIVNPNRSIGTGFQWNFVHINAIHLCKSAGWQEGGSTTAADLLHHNTIFIDHISPAGANAVGFDTFGSYDNVSVNVDNLEGTVSECARLQPTAKNNKIKISCADNSGKGIATGVTLTRGSDDNDIDLTTEGTITTPINDVSGGKNNYRINGKVIQEFRGGSQFNYQPAASAVAGTGATLQAGSTNSEGTVDVGAGNPTTVQIKSSVTFAAPMRCTWTINQPVTWYESASTGSSNTITVSSGLPQHAQVYYSCRGGA
jgi:hypothetical protein